MSGRAVKGGPLSEGAGRCCDSWDVCRERLRWRASRDELGVRTFIRVQYDRSGAVNIRGPLIKQQLAVGHWVIGFTE